MTMMPQRLPDDTGTPPWRCEHLTQTCGGPGRLGRGLAKSVRCFNAGTLGRSTWRSTPSRSHRLGKSSGLVPVCFGMTTETSCTQMALNWRRRMGIAHTGLGTVVVVLTCIKVIHIPGGAGRHELHYQQGGNGSHICGTAGRTDRS